MGSEEVSVLVDFQIVEDLRPPEIVPRGTGNLLAGVEACLSLLDDRKRAYRTAGIDYYRPWLIATVTRDIEVGEVALLQNMVSSRPSIPRFLVVGVGNEEMPNLHAALPESLIALDNWRFKAMFKWLAPGVIGAAREHQQQVSLPAFDWDEARTEEPPEEAKK
jgi:uncharacterized protein YegL